MGSRPRRVLFTGHANGAVQIWDMTTALDLSKANDPSGHKPLTSSAATVTGEHTFHSGGPSALELVRALEQCEVKTRERKKIPEDPLKLITLLTGRRISWIDARTDTPLHSYRNPRSSKGQTSKSTLFASIASAAI